MEKKTFNLSEWLLNAIIQYLGTQPYANVANIIRTIEIEIWWQIRPIENKEEPKEKTLEDKKPKDVK